jgi:Zn-dependent peptidase ImmA (M78 family)
MIKRGIISTKKDTTTCIKEVLTFFRVSSIEAWEKYYKIKEIKYRKSKSFSEDFYSTMIWLRLGEIQAEKIDTASFDKGKFEKKLFKIRELTNEDQFEEAMVSLCAEAGVALTFVSELKKTHLSGATLWQTPNKAVIILSLRYKSDDHFWFSFFHEAGHILLHGKGDVFIDYKEKEADRKKEEAANTFAQNMLMPEEDYDRFVSENTKFYESTIKQFAEQQGIAPGIVVGRLQHDKHINYKSNNQLKRKLKLCEEI